MRRLFLYFIILIVALSLLPQTSFAKTGWVSDMLLLTFRQGPGNSHAVIKTLLSNTEVTILDDQNGFYQVELKSTGTDENDETRETREIGWVDKKFIIFNPPKAILLEQIKKEKISLENQLKKLTSDIQVQKETISSKASEYSNQISPLKESLENSMEENKRLKQNLSSSREKYNTLVKQSKNIQTIVKKNQTLQKENLALSTELSSLKIKNRNLFKTAMIKWFLSGVGVLFLGWLIGQGVSSKKSSYGSILD